MTINSVVPGAPYDSSNPDNYFEFTITGTNTYSEKDIYYEIVLNEDTVLEGKKEENRIKEAENNKITFNVIGINQILEYCVNQAATDTTNCNWQVAINGTQTTDEVINGEGSYYVHVKDNAGNIGHSTPLKVHIPIIENAAQAIINKASTYNEVVASEYQGGVVAINGTEGDNYGLVYNETDATQTIREYRYSGPSVNNYVFFDTNSDGIKDDDEIWRIIGVFKDETNQWNLKLIRNTVLSADEIPASYTYNNTNYELTNATNGLVYIGFGGWENIGIQYFLNGKDGYFGRFSNASQALVNQNYTYNLGVVDFRADYSGDTDGTISDTIVSSYKSERGTIQCDWSTSWPINTNECNILLNNKLYGKALLH